MSLPRRRLGLAAILALATTAHAAASPQRPGHGDATPSRGVAAPQPSADEKAVAAGLAASDTWLALVDAKRYGESWDSAAPLFKNALARDKWTETLDGVRSPLGKALSRKPTSRQHTTTLPGAPDGDYVVIQYETSFENKKAAVETVTPMLAPDGRWRVSGYFIR